MKVSVYATFRAKLGRTRDTKRKHHRGGRRVAHPHRQETGDAGVVHDETQSARSDPRRCERGERKPASEPVSDHSFGEDETADEQKNDRIGEWSVGDLSRCDT